MCVIEQEEGRTAGPASQPDSTSGIVGIDGCFVSSSPPPPSRAAPFGGAPATRTSVEVEGPAGTTGTSPVIIDGLWDAGPATGTSPAHWGAAEGASEGFKRPPPNLSVRLGVLGEGAAEVDASALSGAGDGTLALPPPEECASDPVSLMRLTLRSGSLSVTGAGVAAGVCPGRTRVSHCGKGGDRSRQRRSMKDCDTVVRQQCAADSSLAGPAHLELVSVGIDDAALLVVLACVGPNQEEVVSHRLRGGVQAAMHVVLRAQINHGSDILPAIVPLGEGPTMPDRPALSRRPRPPCRT